jgi:16S rRNA (cytidine1402-2'-O)-methyltransferase
MRTGKLYLIPVPLGLGPIPSVLPDAVISRAKQLGHFVAENAKSARAFLKSIGCTLPLQQIDIRELNEHTLEEELDTLLAPARNGHDIGLISEAGCPAIADPGKNLVALAHQEGIDVVPMVGPSSILLALMASGLSGQSFAFHGYLPVKDELRQKRIRELEHLSRTGKTTQVFIETPYRNQQLFEALIRTCAPDTMICIATDLTLDTERIVTATASIWRNRTRPEIDRRPTVFLFQAA